MFLLSFSYYTVDLNQASYVAAADLMNLNKIVFNVGNKIFVQAHYRDASVLVILRVLPSDAIPQRQ